MKDTRTPWLALPEKARLRSEMLARIRSLSDHEKQALDDAVVRALTTSLSLRKISKPIGMFAPLPDEPDIWPILNRYLQTGITIALPDISSQTLTYRSVRYGDQLRAGRFGIQTPDHSCPVVPPHDLGTVLVPGVAFSPDGLRLGRGGGYFDRFLCSFRGRSIGVCFAFQILPSIPYGNHDQPVQELITENGLFT